MVSFLCSFLLIISGSVSAQVGQRDSRIIITPVSKNYPTGESFPAENYNVAPEVQAKRVLPKERDQWYADLGLSADVAGWDELAKDLLYQRAANYKSNARLFKTYKNIKSAKLKKLRQLMIKKGIKA